MPTDKLRVESNERIDIQDFEFLAHEGIHDNIEQIMENLVCTSTRTKKWILSGFAMSNPPATTNLQVTKGRAILAERRDGVVRYGMLVTEGDATKTIDMNTYAAGDYGIFIRFEPVAGESSSRIFWNPAGAGSEYAQSINTRYQANWSLRVEATSPGAEWTRIGTVAQATMTITDEREFFFEGKVDDSYESGWSTEGGGIANDRNADRAQYGVSDFQMFTAAMRQCLTDLRGRGLREWYEKGIGGINVGFDTDPLEDRVAIGDANFNLYLSGSNAVWTLDTNDELVYNRSSNYLEFYIGSTAIYRWQAADFSPMESGVDLGAAFDRWDTLYARSVDTSIAIDAASADVSAASGSPLSAITSVSGNITNGSNADDGAHGITATAGDATQGDAGSAFYGIAGASTSGGTGGYGAKLFGGNSDSGFSGYGLEATGASGSTSSAYPGIGGKFVGANAYASSALNGAIGVYSNGGNGDGAGEGGAGIEAWGGDGGSGVGGVGGKFFGGDSSSGGGGAGVWGVGYDTGTGVGGSGVIGDGANADSATGEPGKGAVITGGTVNHASNSNHGAIGLEVTGGDSSAGGGFGGDAIYAQGGYGDNDIGGYGVIGLGGNSGAGTGGQGVSGSGGNSVGNYSGGYGVYGSGGTANTPGYAGGVGVFGIGGGHTNSAGTGGAGVRGQGNDGTSGNKAGGAGGLFYGGAGYGTGNGNSGVYAQGGVGGASGLDGPGGKFNGATNSAPINIVPRTNPPDVQSGDVWLCTSDNKLKYRIGSTTYALTGTAE